MKLLLPLPCGGTALLWRSSAFANLKRYTLCVLKAMLECSGELREPTDRALCLGWFLRQKASAGPQADLCASTSDIRFAWVQLRGCPGRAWALNMGCWLNLRPTGLQPY